MQNTKVAFSHCILNEWILKFDFWNEFWMMKIFLTTNCPKISYQMSIHVHFSSWLCEIIATYIASGVKQVGEIKILHNSSLNCMENSFLFTWNEIKINKSNIASYSANPMKNACIMQELWNSCIHFELQKCCINAFTWKKVYTLQFYKHSIQDIKIQG